MSKKSHHFLTLWPWPLTYDLEKLIRSGHYHYQCVYQIWEQSIPWFLSYRVNTIAGGGRLQRKTITSPDPSDTGDIIITGGLGSHFNIKVQRLSCLYNGNSCTGKIMSLYWEAPPPNSIRSLSQSYVSYVFHIITVRMVTCHLFPKYRAKLLLLVSFGDQIIYCTQVIGCTSRRKNNTGHKYFCLKFVKNYPTALKYWY